MCEYCGGYKECPECGMEECPECLSMCDLCKSEKQAARAEKQAANRYDRLLKACQLLHKRWKNERDQRWGRMDAYLVGAPHEFVCGPNGCHVPSDCPTFYDICNCTVETLAYNIDRAKKAEAKVAQLEGKLSSEHMCGHGAQTCDACTDAYSINNRAATKRIVEMEAEIRRLRAGVTKQRYPWKRGDGTTRMIKFK